MKLLPALKWTVQVLGVESVLALFLFRSHWWESTQFPLDNLVVFVVLSILAAGLLLLRVVDRTLASHHD